MVLSVNMCGMAVPIRSNCGFVSVNMCGMVMLQFGQLVV